MNPFTSIRLGAPTLALTAVLATAVAWFAVEGTTRELRTNEIMEAHGQMLAAQVAGMAVDSVIAGDRTSLSGLAHRVAGNPTVRAVAIEALDGQRLAGVGAALSDDPATIFEAPVGFEDAVVARARVVLERDAFAPPVGVIRLTSIGAIGIIAALLFVLSRQLGRAWSITLQSVTAELGRRADHPIPGGADVASAKTLLTELAPAPELEVAPPPTPNAITQINVFNLRALGTEAAHQARVTAFQVAQECAALYGGEAGEHASGAVIHWHAEDEDGVFRGLCAALLAARRLEGRLAADFRLGVHGTSRDAAGEETESLQPTGPNEHRQALTLSALGSGGVAVSAALIGQLHKPEDWIAGQALSRGAWRALNRDSGDPWLLEGTAPRYAELFDSQLRQLTASG